MLHEEIQYGMGFAIPLIVLPQKPLTKEGNMVRNLGGAEKGIRLVLGGALGVAAFILDLPSWGTTTLGVIGFISLLTGLVGFCPAWAIFGINTCRVKPTT